MKSMLKEIKKKKYWDAVDKWDEIQMYHFLSSSNK